MKPASGRRQSADEDKRSGVPSPRLPRYGRPELVVVVLGVMYPSILPQLVEADTLLDLIPIPPRLRGGRQREDVVFYDPLSSVGDGEDVPQAAKYGRNSKGEGQVNRMEAQKAVARDLALLSIRKRR